MLGPLRLQKGSVRVTRILVAEGFIVGAMNFDKMYYSPLLWQ